MKPPPIGWRASRKAVVYSAFWEHVALIRARLRAEGVPHATMLRHERASIKASELERFRHDPTCGVLVMDTSGVVGLDLSFASLVIAMEPVPDGSVLAAYGQVVVVTLNYRLGTLGERHVFVM